VEGHLPAPPQLGLLPEASPGVSEVIFVEKEPAERHAIISWEQKNACVLPEDLKNFYLMTDGFHMTWSVKSDESPMPLGSMTINGISRLNRLGTSPAYSLPSAPTLADLEEADEEGGDKDQPEKPHLDSRSLIFELDPCGGNGKVCLVYKHTKPAVSPDSEIWFLDRALYWHFLTKTFTAYYRLLIAHLGLPQWQYAFTSYGISPQAKVSEGTAACPAPTHLHTFPPQGFGGGGSPRSQVGPPGTRWSQGGLPCSIPPWEALAVAPTAAAGPPARLRLYLCGVGQNP
uniref:Tubulin polyglutamylase complex subunit 2 n=1 Tax=Varanus komodoensis TaxID=61221 RepID=A0A8D2L0W4_VARKO